MTTPAEVLAAYDSQLRRLVPLVVPTGHDYQMLGHLLRVTGQRRGFIESARDLGAEGEILDRLIEEQRDYFAGRGEAVEWKTRAHDHPGDLELRLLAAGFLPEDRETVMAGESATMAVEPMVPEDVQLRQVSGLCDLERIAA